MAALINEQPLFMVDYEKELARYEQAAAELGGALDDSYRTAVLDALIEQILVEQAAAELGIVVTLEMVEQEMTALRTVGDFDAWLASNLYTEAEFKEAVRKGLLTEAAIAQVTADVPQTAAQVHARYIHVADEAAANDLFTRLQAGDDFAFVADQFSLEPGNGGDMGWFAHGSLLVPELEAPAFALQNPGDISGVIPVTAVDGTTSYYLLQLIEQDAARPLNEEMRSFLLQTALADWLATLWEKAEVVRLVETGS
jgi:parvulin-like peptidyl-prolyl isomerase